jgi:hypothetical protein
MNSDSAENDTGMFTGRVDLRIKSGRGSCGKDQHLLAHAIPFCLIRLELKAGTCLLGGERERWNKGFCRQQLTNCGQ